VIWVDALFFGYGGMTGGGTHISQAREVCCRYSEQISDGGLQTYVDTHGSQLEEA
jgi:hypothetical protein